MRKDGMKFDVGERVFVDHTSIFYEAKILDIDTASKPTKYAIHYLGWNARYDESITEDKLLKHNEANVKKAKELEVSGGRKKLVFNLY